MGLFSSNKPEQNLPPNKAKREVCWNSRDKFFECLTKHNIDNSLDPKEKSNVEKNCGSERAEFKNNCVESWFKYFQQKRYNDLIRNRYIEKLEAEGAEPLPFKLGPR
ncbi:Piso0_000994 [Millerozyma farinosa CBS 7064]|uniref:Piso0_000994 protein n=1 Tax=Pichia sorbitophila (strain ATCC MYA-4447 / BCRC 22081 / CBS 7064 / NBRC 10061 / NRRL Y-12695) TaxID=559304 RepID=G8YS35_PICSO|nr:Piso0_000994 [Millerozyma farinosa CBS 7064]CCE78958.1 Piso0_000994 [Millerozyma farinosa CBS 7064]